MRQVEREDALPSGEGITGSWSLLLDNLPEAAFVVASDGTVVYWNGEAERLLEWTRQEILGKDLAELISPSIIDELNSTEGQEREGQAWKGLLAFRLKDGSTMNVMASLSVVSQPGRWHDGVLGVLRTVGEQPNPVRSDIESEEPQCNEQLRESLEEIEAIYDSSPIGMCFLDTDLRYVRINKVLAEMNGVPVKEHIGRTVRQVVPSVSEQVEEAMRKVLLTGMPLLDFELVGETKAMPGVEQTWIESWVPVKGEDGRIVGISVSAMEVTERKRVIRELEAAKGSLQAVLSQLPVALLVLDGRDGHVSFANQEVRSLFHIPDCHFADPKGITCMEWEDRWPDGKAIAPDESPAVRSLRHGEVVKNELHRSQRSDGAWLWTRISSAPVKGEDGSTMSVVVMVTDVTPQIEAQNKILELMESSEIERARLQTILDNLPIGLMITDRNGKLLASNRRNQEIWRGNPEEVPQSIEEFDSYGVWSLDTGEAVEYQDRPLFKIIVQGRTVTGDQYGMRRFDGTLGRIIVSGAPIKSREGGVIGGVIVIQDISEMQRIELELSRRADELARSNAELQQFAYIASHDLREPLRMISSYLGLLERKYRGRVLDATAEEYIKYATDGSIRMQQMINDLLTYSRIDTIGRSFEPTDMNTVIKSAVQNLSVIIEETGATITYHDLPTIWSDRSQMIQLVQNLVDNAIKYRGVELPRVEITAEPKAGRWLFSVKDNGVGVPPIMTERIFQMFQRGYTQEERPGTGIGLAIAKKIVERHGGRIWVESDEGNGATFKFILPERPTGDD